MSASDRLLALDAVCYAISLGKSSLYDLMKNDPTFPRPVKIGARSRWSEARVMAWIEAKVLNAA